MPGPRSTASLPTLTIILAISCLCMPSKLFAAADSPTAVRAPIAGSTVPSVTVKHGEKAVDLAQHLAKGKHLLIVYRGGWCPICTRHFAAIGKAKDQLLAKGWQLSALSPDSPQSIAAWTKQHGDDGIARLSDSSAAATEALGLGFRVDDATMTMLGKYGIDIVAAAGADHRILPVPAVLLLVDGEVRGVHADAKYQRRLDTGVLQAMVAAIEASQAKP